VRAPLAGLTLTIVYVFTPFFLGGQAREFLGEAKEILSHMLRAYPDSVLFLWVAGRLAKMEGRLDDAVELMRRCARATGETIPQVYDLAANEISLIELTRLTPASLRAASLRFASLARVSSWTKAFFTYCQACCLLAMGEAEAAQRAFARVPSLCARKVAGRLISEENFASRRSTEVLAPSSSVLGIGASSARVGVGSPFSGGCWTIAHTPEGAAASTPLDTVEEVDEADDQEVRRAMLAESDDDAPPPPAATVPPPASWLLPALEVAYVYNAASQSAPSALCRWVAATDSALVQLLPPGLESPVPFFPAASDPALLELRSGSASIAHSLTAAVCGCGLREAAKLTPPRELEAARLTGSRADDVGLCALIRGAALAHIGETAQADECFAWVCERGAMFRRDAHLVPFALLERASLRLSRERADVALSGPLGAEAWRAAVEEASRFVDGAWAYSRDFNFKPRLHVRIHLLSDWAATITARAGVE
jgi:hypothetical protein